MKKNILINTGAETENNFSEKPVREQNLVDKVHRNTQFKTSENGEHSSEIIDEGKSENGTSKFEKGEDSSYTAAESELKCNDKTAGDDLVDNTHLKEGNMDQVNENEETDPSDASFNDRKASVKQLNEMGPEDISGGENLGVSKSSKSLEATGG